MKTVKLIAFVILLLGLAACSANAATAATPEAIPTVIADNTIISEGRVEPMHYADIAVTTSGTIGEVLVEEGQQLKRTNPDPPGWLIGCGLYHGPAQMVRPNKPSTTSRRLRMKHVRRR